MKLTKNQKIFSDGNIEINSMLYEMSDKEIDKILLMQKKDRDELLSKLANIMLEYEVKDDKLSLNNIQKAKILKKITKEISNKFSNEIKLENIQIDKLFSSISEDKYYLNTYLLSLGLDFSAKKVSDKVLKSIVNEKVNGKLYSDRLWSNKNELSKILKKEIRDFISGNTSVNDISNIIKKKFNRNAYETKRLITNETARILEEVNNKWMDDLGVEYVMYLSTLDGSTCEECNMYDSKVYKANDKPVELPQHVGCRCTYSAIPSNDWKPKNRMDNTNKSIIDYKEYKDWKENNVS